MKIVMKLDKIPLNKIITGTKKIETRLFDKKRQEINKGDEILFIQNNDINITQKVIVIWLFKYDTFEELFNKHSNLFGWDKKEFLIEEIYSFYLKEKEQQCWVIWIHFELI